jgi:hypothetical protein
MNLSTLRSVAAALSSTTQTPPARRPCLPDGPWRALAEAFDEATRQAKELGLAVEALKRRQRKDRALLARAGGPPEGRAR